MPLFRKPEQSNSHKLGMWIVEETYDQLLNQCIESGWNVEDQFAFKNNLKKKHWLAARCLTNAMDGEIRTISYDSLGAPHTDNSEFISLSHSNLLVAVLLNKENDVGIDIQHFSPKIERIKSKFCGERELNYARGRHHFEFLHIIWSAKEAIYKQMKRPGLIFKDEIEILPFEFSEKGILSAKISTTDFDKVMNLGFEIVEDYSLVYTLNP